jgi:hypothetical protein
VAFFILLAKPLSRQPIFGKFSISQRQNILTAELAANLKKSDTSKKMRVLLNKNSLSFLVR